MELAAEYLRIMERCRNRGDWDGYAKAYQQYHSLLTSGEAAHAGE